MKTDPSEDRTKVLFSIFSKLQKFIIGSNNSWSENLWFWLIINFHNFWKIEKGAWVQSLAGSVFILRFQFQTILTKIWSWHDITGIVYLDIRYSWVAWVVNAFGHLGRTKVFVYVFFSGIRTHDKMAINTDKQTYKHFLHVIFYPEKLKEGY